MRKALRTGILLLAWLGSGCPGTASDSTDPGVDSGSNMNTDMASPGPGDMGGTPVSKWPRQFGDSSDQLSTGVAIDHQNNVIVVGNFVGKADFGGGSLTSAGSNDVFIAKYSADGTHLWSKRFGGTYEEWVASVTVDSSNNIIIAGYFEGNTSLGGLGLTNQGAQDIFVAKYGADGVHLWSKAFGSSAEEEAVAVAVDSADNVLLTGWFDGSVNFGGSALNSAGMSDTFLVKLMSSGAHSWSHGYGGTMADLPAGIAVDGSDNVFLSATFTGMSNFGGTTLTSAGGSDVAIAKYASTGTHLWSSRFGGTSSDASGAIAADSSGNVIAVGSFQGTAGFGGTNLVSLGARDVFFAKYSGSGAHVFSKGLGGTMTDRAYSASVSRNGDIFIAGSFAGAADFGGGTLNSAGLDDMWVGKYHSDGSHVWSSSYGGTNLDEAIGIQPDGAGGAVILGYFQDKGTFGGVQLTSAGGWDIAVLTHTP